MKTKLNTVYITVGVVILVGILFYIFKKPSKSQEKPFVPPIITPLTSSIFLNGKKGKGASVPPKVYPIRYMPTDEEIENEITYIKNNLIQECGGLTAEITVDCFNFFRSKLSKLESMFRIKLNDPTMSEEDKIIGGKLIDTIDKIKPMLTQEFFEANLRGKTLNDIFYIYLLPILETL